MSAPVVIGPRDVASLRVHLMEQWLPGRIFYRVMGAATVDHRSRIDPDALDVLDGMSSAQRADSASRWERTILARSSLWWVSPAMGDLLVAAMQSIPDDVHVSDLPLFDRNAFVVFAEPLRLHGTHVDEIVEAGAFAFGPSNLPAIFPHRPEPMLGDGIKSISMSFYEHENLDDGLSSRSLQHSGTLITEAMASGEIQSTDQGGGRFMLHGDLWVPLGRSDWPEADPLGRADLIINGATAQASYIEDRKLYAAFVTLLHQEGIAQTTTEWPHRAAVRRTQRAGLPREAASVRVVRLRELHGATHDHGEHEPREWAHRWIVQGHWRNARVGPGRTQRRLVWVNPHVKGPADKPLTVPTVVKAWIR